ncbi:MAG: tetratricopeptide repeat protein [bacterium]
MLIAIILSPSYLFSQSEVENFAPGSRAIGYGGSLVVQVRDPSAIFWNPAVLSGLKDRELLISINEPFGFDLVSLTQFIPLYGTYGIAFSRITTSTESVDRGTVALGREIVKRFSVGTIFNIEKREDDWFATAGLGFFIGNSQIGTLGQNWRDISNSKLLDKLNLGLTIHNIPLSEKLFEPSALLGFSYIFPSMGLLINSGYHLLNGDKTSHFGIGLEISRNITVFSGIEEGDFNKWGAGIDFTHDNFLFDVTYSTEFKRILITLSARISPKPEVLAEPYYESGTTYVKSGNYISAAREFKKFLSFDLNESKTDTVRQLVNVLDKRITRTQIKVDSLFAVAEKLLTQGDPQYLRSALILTKILELDNSNLNARRKLTSLKPVIDEFVKKSLVDGINEFDSKKYFAARDIFRRIILFDNKNEVALKYISEVDRILNDLGEEYFNRGVGYYHQKNYYVAKEEFLRALKYNPNSEVSKSYLRRTNEKIEDLQQQIITLFQAGQKFESKRKYVAAANKYLQVLKLDKDNQKTKKKLANLRPKIDRFVKKKYREGLKFYHEERFDEAQEAFLTVLSIDPKHRAARKNLTNLQIERKDKALSYLTQAEDYFQKQDWQSALELFTKTLKIDPTHSMAAQRKKETLRQLQITNLLEEGRNKYNAQNLIEAVEIYNKVLQLDSNNDQAKKELTKCKEKINEKVEKYFNEGINFYTLDRYEEAIEKWNEALKFDPNHKGSLEYKQKALQRLKALKALKTNE